MYALVTLQLEIVCGCLLLLDQLLNGEQLEYAPAAPQSKSKSPVSVERCGFLAKRHLCRQATP